MSTERQPLLASSFGDGVHQQNGGGAWIGGAGEVSAEEVRAASAYFDSYYPPSIHSALLPSPQPSLASVHSSASADLAALAVPAPAPPPGRPDADNFGREFLDEIEIRQLLIDHVGHRFCWGSQPARRWQISAIEDCNVYVGTLDTFIDERETITESVPYVGGPIDGRDQRRAPNMWELDLTSHFPSTLYVPHEEVRVNVPRSEEIVTCSDCSGRGEIACPTCNASLDGGFYNQNQMTRCPMCHGRGLIAHRDGGDTRCQRCDGRGTLPCPTCGSRGLVGCTTCEGRGSILTRTIAIVKWTTLSARKVLPNSAAASVPDEVFHKATGLQLHKAQAYQCSPAYFPDSYRLNRFSSEVIASRPPIPPTATVISEQHIISVVPVTRVTMVHGSKSFTFYIIGRQPREVFIREYPSKFCWGLCCCL